jgi:hypothetical protein
MKQGALFLFLLGASCAVNAQDCPLMIGKRLALRREIDPAHLGAPNNAFRRIYFRTDSSEFTRIGIYGRRLVPYFRMNPSSWDEFIKFKASRAGTHALLVSSVTSFLIWNMVSVDVLLQTYNVPNAYFGWKSLPWLVASQVFYYAGYLLDLRADRHLGMGMFHYNRNVCGYFSIPKLSQ